MNSHRYKFRFELSVLASIMAFGLSACSSPMPKHTPPPSTPPPVVLRPVTPNASAPASTPAPAAQNQPTVSTARSVEQYRIDLARHILGKLNAKVLPEPLPNPLHGIAVVEMTIGRDGRLQGITPLRIPSHAPETRRWINELLAAAAPLPQPQFAAGNKANVVVTETWFFMPDGRFNLRALQPVQAD